MVKDWGSTERQDTQYATGILSIEQRKSKQGYRRGLIRAETYWNAIDIDCTWNQVRREG
jgi:hypothetical protein